MKTQEAIFGAGCFWGVQDYFDQVPGVVETEVGYTGGHTDNPTYWDVASQRSGHVESIKITYDPKKVSYGTLLKHFFRMHDPTQINRQGPDIGPEYRSAIFYTSDDQKKEADKMIEEYNKFSSRGKVVTTVEPAGKFWPAEEEHQKFVKKTGIGSCHISYSPL